MAEGKSSPDSKVKFQDNAGEKPNLIKHVPTQKYNRKEIQKRLVVENWMDEQLKDLYQTEVGVCMRVCII